MPDRVMEACEACFGSHSGDCSGFARAVAQQLGVPLAGLANDIVKTIRAGGGWLPLADGIAAAAAARSGGFVVAGLLGSEQLHPNAHGHVAVVVAGELGNGKYPVAYWGRLGGTGLKKRTVNFAWNRTDRDKVTYAVHSLPRARRPVQ